MTQLLVDIGNTNVKFAESSSIDVVRVIPVSELDEYQLNQKIDLSPDEVFISNVSNDHVIKILKASFDVQMYQFISTEKCCGITNAYSNPSQLGVDRWLALHGVHFQQQPCMIVDIGTALTIDFVDTTGQHLGGWIMPGFTLMQQCLISGATQLDVVSNNMDSTLASKTGDAIANGSLVMVSETLNGLYKKYKQTLGGDLLPIITGGGAKPCLRFLDHAFVEQPNLLFKGMVSLLSQSHYSINDFARGISST
ncbi:MAG: type III pantothenate kinase [Methylococcales bacterium]|jgi:type III pantothenate kinase|nr:type III pantothenate kinase [Methylococcales bacterium]MBT7443887.1 type III pantothenate kinase [Methylococcales bacterium]